MPYGQLEVTVVEGRNLKQVDFFDNVDPLVCLSLDKQNKQQTRAIEDATWNQKFTFNVLEGRNELFLEVFDEEIDNEDLIGGTTVSLYQVFEQSYLDQWFNITRPSGKSVGEIHLIMSFKCQGPKSGPAGHTPYPVLSKKGYFSPPNSGSSANNIYPVDVQQEVYSNLGPEGGEIPLDYGSSAPPHIKVPHSAGPLSYPTAGDGFPDPSSYGVKKDK